MMESTDNFGDSKFLTQEELMVGTDFLRDGYKIIPTSDFDALSSLRFEIVTAAAEFLNHDVPVDHEEFLNSIHLILDRKKINSLRLFVFEKLNTLSWVRNAYWRCAKDLLAAIVGNELVMQRKINLSIQMPDDQSSVLPVHADTWSGDSPFEVVLWIPFVNVSKTKSMFVLPIDKNKEHLQTLENSSITKTSEIMDQILPDLQWLDLKYGEIVLFTQNIMHGNVVNQEASSRWSTNCRFKSAFSPYADKRLGEFFDPIILRPATLLGSRYKLPNFRS